MTRFCTNSTRSDFYSSRVCTNLPETRKDLVEFVWKLVTLLKVGECQETSRPGVSRGEGQDPGYSSKVWSVTRFIDSVTRKVYSIWSLCSSSGVTKLKRRKKPENSENARGFSTLKAV